MKPKQAGNNWEEAVAIECRTLMWRGCAKVEKLPDPVSIQQRALDGKVMGYTLKREFPDFMGTLKGGQGVVFEAKTTAEENRWPLAALRDKGKKGDQKSQLEILTAHRKMGAIAFVYLEQRADHATWTKRYLLPVKPDGTVAGYGPDYASIPFDEIGRYELSRVENWFDKLSSLAREAAAAGSDEIRSSSVDVSAPTKTRTVDAAAPEEI